MKYKLKHWQDIKDIIAIPVAILALLLGFVLVAHMIMVVIDLFYTIESATNGERLFGWGAWAIALPIGLFFTFFEKDEL